MKKLRTLAALISIAMLFSSLVSAATPLNDTVVAEEAPTLLATDLPETININDARDRGHIERLKSEESDMYSAIFRNNNGTQSMYMFASPIKYKTPEGEIRDKSTKLTKTSTGYTMSDNDVNVSFETTANMSANLSYNDNLITIIPVTESKANGILKENALIYNDALGENTTLCYKPLLSGMNQEIILHSPETDSTYSFKLNTRKLIAKQNGNGVIDINNAEDTTIFKFSTYIVQDANGRTLENNLKIKANTPQSYTITIDLNDSILNEADIAYPLSVSLGVTLNTSSAIEDTVIYSNRPTRNYGTRSYHNIGYLDDTYGIGRMLVKFPSLETNTTYLNLKPTNIDSASFCMYTASGYDTNVNHNTIIYRPDSSWDESTATWSTTQSDEDELMNFSNPVYTPRTGGSLVEYDLTAVTRYWLNNTNARQRGLLFTAMVELQNYPVVDFCSTEYANSHNGTYMPYLTLTYYSDNLSLHFNVLYDKAFRDRAYDELTGSPTTPAIRIQQLMDPVVEMYRDRFGINITYTPVSYISYCEAENCTACLSPSSLCNCSVSCTNGGQFHHTNQTNLMQHVQAGAHGSHFNIYLTGQKTCLATENTCTGSGNWGICYYAIGKIGIFCTDTSDLNMNIVIRKTIAHEINHLYGTDDHYDPNIPLLNGQANNCIHGTNRNQSPIAETFTLCDYCLFTICKNIDTYNHH